ncbi:MAG: hypothetical protein J5J06_16675 [Phycisphaerae bacterium]|nr:hypothetical protein [Phycisphaerae bacterium]
MPANEIIAWFFSAVLGGILVGALTTLGLVTLARRTRSSRLRREAIEAAWTSWLAAHRTLHRSARSLVWAYRGLPLRSATGESDQVRAWDCLRVRERFFDACQELDRAEAELWRHGQLAHHEEGAARNCACQATALRMAIEGDSNELAGWSRNVQRCETRMEAMARESLSRIEPWRWRRSRLTRLVHATGEALNGLVERWSGRP